MSDYAIAEPVTFSVVHFNNGMHGWAYSEAEYRAAFPSLIAELHALLDQSRNGVAEVLAGLRLPGVPNRMEMDALASSMFSRARSLEEIVDRAYRLLMTAVANHLLAGPETA